MAVIIKEVKKPRMLEIGAIEIFKGWIENPEILVDGMVADLSDRKIGAGREYDLSSSLLTQWKGFVKALSTRGVEEHNKAALAARGLLTAINATSEEKAPDPTTAQALAELYRDLYLEKSEKDDNQDKKPRLRQGMKKVVERRVDELCRNTSANSKDKNTVISAMEAYWNFYLNRYTNSQYGFTGKVGEHGLCDVFEAEHEAVLETMAEKDFNFSGAFMAAGANVFIKAIKETDNPDLAMRLVNQTITLFVRSPIADALAKKEEEGEGSNLTKTLRSLQSTLIYKLIGLKGLPNSIGWETEDEEPDPKVLNHFTTWIEAHREKDPEELIFEMIFLQARRDSLLKRKPKEGDLLGEPPDTEKLVKFFEGLTAAIESSTEALASGKLAVALELMSAMRSFSPLVYAGFAADIALGRVTKYTRKGSPEKLKALFDALKMSDEKRSKLTRDELFYRVFNTSGHQVLLDDILGLPTDTDITNTLNMAFTMVKGYREDGTPITTNILESLIIGIGETPGSGSQPPGLTYLFDKDLPLTLDQRLMFFMPYLQGVLARIRDKRLNKPEGIKDEQAVAVRNFIATELLGLGRMLMERKAEMEEIKGVKFGEKGIDTNPRQQYIGLLIDILTDDGALFAGEVRSMAEKVVKYCLPYWSMESQKHFIKTFTGRLKNDRGDLEKYRKNGLFYNVFYWLGVRGSNLPEVKGEKNRIRPIAKDIITYLEKFLLGYPDWMRPSPPDRLVDALVVDLEFEDDGEVATTKPETEMSLFGLAMRLRDKLATKKENKELGRKLAAQVTVEMKDDILNLIPEGAKDQVMRVQNLILGEQGQIAAQENLLMNILKKTATILMKTPVISFDPETGILETTGLDGRQGQIESLVNQRLETDEKRRSFLDQLLKRLADQAAETGKALTPVELTQRLAGGGISEGKSPLMDAMAKMVASVTSPIVQGKPQNGVGDRSRPTPSYFFGRDPFSAAFGFASKMAKRTLINQAQAQEAIANMLPTILTARKEDVQRGLGLAREVRRIESMRLREQLRQAIIGQYHAQVVDNTQQQAMILQSQQALVKAVTDQFTAQLAELEKVEGYLRGTQGKRDELWHKQADLALETYKLKVITEINIVNSLLTKFYNYSQRRAIELGEALIRTFEVGNQYADKYRELIERGYDPEGEVKDRILKAQAALRKHWGIQVAIPLPEIPAPPAAAASASQVEEVA